MEFDSIMSLEHLIIFAGLALFAVWLHRTSLGRNALADSQPRRNNMPLYLPFVPLFLWFGVVSLMSWIAQRLLTGLQDWQRDFLDNVILCVGEIITIAVIIFFARNCFLRRLKGFGLNIKAVPKDLLMAFVNLLAVWPLITAAMLLTAYVGRLISGGEYEMQQHQQLKLIGEHPQLLSRILIVFIAVAVAPLLEEMLFRGLFQTAIRSYIEALRPLRLSQDTPEEEHTNYKYVAWPAVFISSVLFTMTHANAGHWPALFVLGICMGYSYEKSGSLFRPIFIHSIFNGISVIATLNQ
jgi:hypothetical protein